MIRFGAVRGEARFGCGVRNGIRTRGVVLGNQAFIVVLGRIVIGPRSLSTGGVAASAVGTGGYGSAIGLLPSRVGDT